MSTTTKSSTSKTTEAAPRDPVQIIQECILDIDAGLWMCGHLHDPGAKGANKPMGCAIGLLGINGGAATIERVPLDQKDGLRNTSQDGEQWVPAGCVYVASMNYPNEDRGNEWSEEARRAVGYLAKAVDDVGGYVEEEGDDIDTQTGTVVECNDSYIDGPEQAKAWFSAALERAKRGERT